MFQPPKLSKGLLQSVVQQALNCLFQGIVVRKDKQVDHDLRPIWQMDGRLI